MNDRELLASLVGSLAWPVTVFIVSLVFRKPVSRFIDRLKRFKFGDFEAEAEAEVRTAERLIQAQPIPVLPPELPGPAALQYFKTVARVSPRATIIEAWTSFEAEFQGAAIARGILKPGEPVAFPRAFHQLLEAELVGPDEAAVLTRFRELRNRVVHDSKAVVSADTALRYAAVLQAITERIRGTPHR